MEATHRRRIHRQHTPSNPWSTFQQAGGGDGIVVNGALLTAKESSTTAGTHQLGSSGAVSRATWQAAIVSDESLRDTTKTFVSA